MIFRPIKPENPEEPKIITYLVEFKDEQSGEIIFSQEIEKNNPLNEIPVAPEKTGFRFINWQLDGIAINLEELVIKDNLIIIANYSDFFACNFRVDGSDYQIGSAKYGLTLSEIKPDENPIKTGYDFIGWSVSGELVNDSYIFSGTTNFEAVFEEKLITLNLYTTETEQLSSTTLQYGSTFTFPEIETVQDSNGNNCYLGLFWKNVLTGDKYTPGTEIELTEQTAGNYRALYKFYECDGTFTCESLIEDEVYSNVLIITYDLEKKRLLFSDIGGKLTNDNATWWSSLRCSTTYTDENGNLFKEGLTCNYSSSDTWIYSLKQYDSESSNYKVIKSYNFIKISEPDGFYL